MANINSIAQEQIAQRELLELILRNQFASMTYLARVDNEIGLEIRVMLTATAKWLETETKTEISV